jgi:hypothetical protein
MCKLHIYQRSSLAAMVIDRAKNIQAQSNQDDMNMPTLAGARPDQDCSPSTQGVLTSVL